MDINHNDKFTNILRSSLTEGVKYLAKEEKSKGYIVTYMYIYKLIIIEEQLEKNIFWLFDKFNITVYTIDPYQENFWMKYIMFPTILLIILCNHNLVYVGRSKR